MQTEQRLELLDRSAIRVYDVDPRHLVGLGELRATSERDVGFLENLRRRVGDEGRQEPLVSDHRPGERRIAEVPDYGRGQPSGGKHARPRTSDGRVDVL